jgi:hypothetical protein
MAGLRPLAALTPKAARTAFARKGFGAAEILTQWAAIVGPTVAAYAVPERLVFPPGQRVDGALHVTVAPGGFATELQHLEPLVLDRINGFFGYRAVARLKLHQRPLPLAPRPRRRQPPAPLSPAQAEHLHKAVGDIRDQRLRDALSSLGREILGASRKT